MLNNTEILPPAIKYPPAEKTSNLFGSVPESVEKLFDSSKYDL